jgi:hypothetical protein
VSNDALGLISPGKIPDNDGIQNENEYPFLKYLKLLTPLANVFANDFLSISNDCLGGTLDERHCSFYRLYKNRFSFSTK